MINGHDHGNLPHLPPRAFMEQIMDKIASTYCFLWDHKNNDNRVSMTWHEISLHFHKNSFRATLRRLNKEGLLSYKEFEEHINIELVAWDDVCNNF